MRFDRTGYHSPKHKLRKILSQEILDKASDLWGLDAEGEIKGAYRLTGYPGVCLFVISSIFKK